MVGEPRDPSADAGQPEEWPFSSPETRRVLESCIRDRIYNEAVRAEDELREQFTRAFFRSALSAPEKGESISGEQKERINQAFFIKNKWFSLGDLETDFGGNISGDVWNDPRTVVLVEETFEEIIYELDPKGKFAEYSSKYLETKSIHTIPGVGVANGLDYQGAIEHWVEDGEVCFGFVFTAIIPAEQLKGKEGMVADHPYAIFQSLCRDFVKSQKKQLDSVFSEARRCLRHSGEVYDRKRNTFTHVLISVEALNGWVDGISDDDLESWGLTRGDLREYAFAFTENYISNTYAKTFRGFQNKAESDNRKRRSRANKRRRDLARWKIQDTEKELQEEHSFVITFNPEEGVVLEHSVDTWLW